MIQTLNSLASDDLKWGWLTYSCIKLKVAIKHVSIVESNLIRLNET